MKIGNFDSDDSDSDGSIELSWLRPVNGRLDQLKLKRLRIDDDNG
jgi:hypothetical protein